MNKKSMLIIIIALIIVVLILFVFKIGKKNINKSYYEIDLDANYELNNMWDYTFSEDGIVEVKKSEYDNETNKQHYEFIGLKKGKVEVIFKLKNEEKIIEEKSIILKVDKKLNIKEN